jgi:hypothetical protein
MYRPVTLIFIFYQYFVWHQEVEFLFKIIRKIKQYSWYFEIWYLMVPVIMVFLEPKNVCCKDLYVSKYLLQKTDHLKFKLCLSY